MPPSDKASDIDTPTHHAIPAQALTDAAFAPYGEIIKPRPSGEQFDRSRPYDPEREETHVRLVIGDGRPTLRIMHQRRRGLVFAQMARHRRVSQCLGSLQGKQWFLAVAAPTDVADHAHPKLQDVTAFSIPGDRIVKLHVGTWHAGPHFIHDECLFLNLEHQDTNTADFQDLPLPRPCRIEP